MAQNTNTNEYTLTHVFDRFVGFVGTVIKYIEIAIALALIGTLFLIVSVIEALF